MVPARVIPCLVLMLALALAQAKARQAEMTMLIYSSSSPENAVAQSEGNAMHCQVSNRPFRRWEQAKLALSE